MTHYHKFSRRIKERSESHGISRPIMIEIENDIHAEEKRRGETTIPSVVAFVPNIDNYNYQQSPSVVPPPPPLLNNDAGSSHHLHLQNLKVSLPPKWETMTRTMSSSSTPSSWGVSLPSSAHLPIMNKHYQILVGNSAIHYENQYPNSTYRNVKRVIGTGGRVAKMAFGVVPNLFVDDDNQNNNNYDDLSLSSRRSNSNKKSKTMRRKRESEGLPKLHKQLEEARTYPALLKYDITNDVAFTPSASLTTTTTTEEEILLCPEQISACILRKLYNAAEQYWHDHNPSKGSRKDDDVVVRVTRAVIGVPAYFTESQRQATILASELAGVSKVKLLPEPEAAALAYGSMSSSSSSSTSRYRSSSEEGEELILVFDLGGGTFDVSVVEVGGGVSEVIATSGDNRLGGTDFDERVAEYLCMCAVEYGKSQGGSSLEKTKNKKLNNKKMKGGERQMGVADASSVESGDISSNVDTTNAEREMRRRIPVVKDWYRQGSGDVPSIILRVAEKVRIRLSNQKLVEVLVPLTQDGWRKFGGGGGGGDDEPSSPTSLLGSDMIVGPLFDKMTLETEQGMVEGIDYIIVSLDRKMFESICSNELQRLLRPLREVAIMARVLLPGEARPSFVENAKAIMMEMKGIAEVETGYFDDEIDFWEVADELTTTGDDGYVENAATEEKLLDEQALRQIQAMDIKSQKKAQQRGRKLSRDIDKRERSFRKQKQSAMEDATTASLLGRQLGGGGVNGMKRGLVGGGGKVAATSLQQTSVGLMSNERVQEGIHGRPISRIILVGGATRMPVIGKLLEAVVGIVPQRTVNPDEAVALGCAVQVGILDGVNDGLLGGVQAVLSPMQAAVMRALAKKQLVPGADGIIDAREIMEGQNDGLIVVDEFDDEDDFY